MKLSEEIKEMAGDYTYISGSWLSICAEEAEALENKIAELEAQTQWVSVDERLPECDKHSGGDNYYSDMVLQFDRDIGYGIGRVINDDFASPTVTHWMPLPKPPEDE